MCNANHKIYYCPKFLRLSISDRLDKVNSLKPCLNCLCSGHKADSCKYGHCAKYPNKHNSLLHADQPHSNSQSGNGSRQGTAGADQGAEGQMLTSYSVASNQQLITLQLGSHENSKTLGLIWQPQRDVLLFKIQEQEGSVKSTMRAILSYIAQIYDPLGLLGPCTIIAKILLQRLWLQNLTWDEPVPPEIQTLWAQLRHELPSLNSLEIPRHVQCNYLMTIQLHTFCDASEDAYCASAYTRSVDNDGSVYVQLLCANPKVAPLKRTTLPRLELCGALIAARLTETIIQSQTYSTTVLGWINTPSHLLKTFVSNRISEIQPKTDPGKNWHHLNTKDNPAEMLLRGVSPYTLLNSPFWWRGPQWLSQEAFISPVSTRSSEKLPELRSNKAHKTVLTAQKLDTFPISRFSSLTRLNRVTVSVHFAAELRCLEQRKSVSRTSKILKLDPFMDSDGILRVGGRLQYSNMSYDKRHPILLPPDTHFTILICSHYHHQLLHAGAQHLLAAIREHFWIISARRVVTKIASRCITCFRVGTLVVIKDNNLPPLCWLMARVIDVHPGEDGIVKIVSLRTSKGIIKRAVATICPLPTEEFWRT
nr:unnamed protein product [Callosobruchus chinensis]